MTPAPMMKHQEVSLNIAFQLKRLLSKSQCCKTYQAIDWQIEPDTVLQPDVLVVCGDHRQKEKLLIPPVLVFEILSPSTSRKDRGLKYRLYQDAGVKYYCIVDPDNRCAEVYLLKEEKYNEIGEFKEEKITFGLGPCVIDFDFAEIFE
jgi:Uma2 family endonuclease